MKPKSLAAILIVSVLLGTNFIIGMADEAGRADAAFTANGKPAVSEADVHVVGLYHAADGQHFRLVHSWFKDTDWERLSATLIAQGKKEATNPGKRVWDLLKADARAVVTNKEMMKRLSMWATDDQGDTEPEIEMLRAGRRLADGLEEVLRRPDFYEEKSFTDITLDDEGKELLKRRKDLLLLESWVLNRRLFEASFPDAVKKSSFTLNKATVPVRVVATKTPIILVLCSYESVLWEVRPDKGAKIEKIIVGGYHLQAIRGTDAPVTYRTYEPKVNSTYFYAYKKDDENYGKMAAAVRNLTGKGITSFQGRSSYDKGSPFVVGAKE